MPAKAQTNGTKETTEPAKSSTLHISGFPPDVLRDIGLVARMRNQTIKACIISVLQAAIDEGLPEGMRIKYDGSSK